jgi:hypothetical protein
MGYHHEHASLLISSGDRLQTTVSQITNRMPQAVFFFFNILPQVCSLPAFAQPRKVIIDCDLGIDSGYSTHSEVVLPCKVG